MKTDQSILDENKGSMPPKLTPHKKTVWITWDLALRADYDNFYSWLDKNGAKECGDSSAVIMSDRFVGKDIPETIKEELEDTVSLKSNDRIYVIYIDSKTKKIKGRFIFGGRKRNPWEGYNDSEDEKFEDVEE